MKVRPFTIDNSQLYWKDEKWDGRNKKWMEHVRDIIYEVTRQRNEIREDSSRFKTVDHALMYFHLIQHERINSKEQLESNKRISDLLESIKSQERRKLRQSFTTIVSTSNKFELLDDSDSDDENPVVYDQNEFEKVSEYIHKMIMASLSGEALSALKEFWFLKIAKGFETVGRLVDIFGQKLEQTYFLPCTIPWTKNGDTNAEWQNFKLIIESEKFLRDHPTGEMTAIQCAKIGLAKTPKGNRALEQVRFELGSRPECWIKFKEVLDRFFGDRFKENFDSKTFEYPIDVLSFNIHNPIDSVNKITNIKTKPNQYPHLNLNAEKKIFKKESTRIKIKKTGKGKPIPHTCGWCGKNHPTFLCKSKRDSKWKTHMCTNCKGIGHPKAVCPTIKVRKVPESMDIGAVFLVKTHTANSVIRYPSTQCMKKLDNKAQIIIDSGASVSVAPYDSFSKQELDKTEKNKYRIQNASGAKIKIYGSRNVPFKFDNHTILIKFIICDVIQPLISTNDLLNAGATVIIDKEDPMIKINATLYSLMPLGKH